MKIIKALLMLTFFSFFSVKAQISNPVKWKAKIQKKSSSEYILTFAGKLEKDWHLYSLATPEGGPLPLEFTFLNSKGKYETVGKAKESATTTTFNTLFEVNETYFTNNFTITQVIKVNNKLNTSIAVELSYQICKEVCIPQKSYFEFDIPNLKAKEIIKSKLKNKTIKS
ncbi:protein-disulfide reductase DsbD domain-containing protein [Flavobacterium aquatile]|nr:protein-disulfide reductase DsbD domain-containing protein [Flavobacterium aquatile]